MLMDDDKNRANIRALNAMNKTALYYATEARKKAYGWNRETSHTINLQ